MNLNSKHDTVDQTLKALADLNHESATFEQTADRLFESFGQLIPYDRIGIAILSPDRETLELSWVKSRLPAHSLNRGFSAQLSGSSLEQILIHDRPRIISDLSEYLKLHPGSDSTRRAVMDGIRSSFTCPLRSSNGAIGVIFFSSYCVGTYANEHVHIYSLIASTIATSLERKLEKSHQAVLSNRETFYRKALHDLRNPLTVLKAQVDLALINRYGVLTPMMEKAIETMRKQAEMMTNLLDHIQDALELGVADFLVQQRAVNLEEYLDTMSMAAESLTNVRSITFKLVRATDLPTTAYFDPQRISQAIGNLLTNALKFSRPQSQITLYVRLENRELHFAIQDQGVGIPKLEIPKLFSEKQKKIKSAPAGFERCQGLGLSIVKKIISDHGGKVWVESQLGLGSTFHFVLPQADGAQNS